MGNKILLADDSITIQKVIELTFSDEDFDVVTVGNGRLAMDRLEEVRPDIVLCDIIMPEKDGYEVCDFIKKSAAFSHVPVLLLTGAFEPFDQERAARVGCDGFLAKPFEPQSLIAKVKDLLAQAASRPKAAAAPQAEESEEAQTLPGSRPASLAQPLPPAPVAAPVTFMPVEEPEPLVDDGGAGSFDAPMDLSTEEAPPYVRGEGGPLESELYSSEEPVVAAPEEFMPLMADEAESLASPPPFSGEAEPVFEPEPSPEFEPPPAVEPAPVFEPGPAFSVRPAAPIEPMVEEDDGASTVVFRAGEAPPWSQPTAELSFEARAEAAARQQAAPAPPVFEEVPEDEPEMPPPPPAFQASGVAAAAEPPPTLAEPEPVSAAAEVPEESFEAVAPPASPVPDSISPSAAAEVAVPVDQVAQIAQRVVAQISEKVVREIAWEVIPDLAEALIKKEIERLKAELERT
jgi:CheY-like chemotaxis protein